MKKEVIAILGFVTILHTGVVRAESVDLTAISPAGNVGVSTSIDMDVSAPVLQVHTGTRRVCAGSACADVRAGETLVVADHAFVIVPSDVAACPTPALSELVSLQWCER